jgi:hypothetical protein
VAGKRLGRLYGAALLRSGPTNPTVENDAQLDAAAIRPLWSDPDRFCPRNRLRCRDIIGEPKMTRFHEGGCLCGELRYTAFGDPMRVTVCHCTWCQRRTGSAFAVEALFDQAQVRITGVTSRFRSVSDESGRWLELDFCPKCGASIGFTFERLQGHRMIDCGTFDDPSWISPGRFEFRYVYLRSAQCWSDVPEGAQTFDRFFPT